MESTTKHVLFEGHAEFCEYESKEIATLPKAVVQSLQVGSFPARSPHVILAVGWLDVRFEYKEGSDRHGGLCDDAAVVLIRSVKQSLSCVNLAYTTFSITSTRTKLHASSEKFFTNFPNSTRDIQSVHTDINTHNNSFRWMLSVAYVLGSGEVVEVNGFAPLEGLFRTVPVHIHVIEDSGVKVAERRGLAVEGENAIAVEQVSKPHALCRVEIKKNNLVSDER